MFGLKYLAWVIIFTLSMVISICLSCPSAFASGKGQAVPKPLTGKDLRAVFENTTMIGEYRTYRNETRTYTYSEYHKKDGTTDYTEGRKTEDGRWKIIGEDKICYNYPGSKYYTHIYCFFVFNQDGCYYKFAPNNMSIKHVPKNWDKWSSRAVRKGAGGLCDVPVS